MVGLAVLSPPYIVGKNHEPFLLYNQFRYVPMVNPNKSPTG